jgi:RimJ/RimL family protein N-acetyltransferase
LPYQFLLDYLGFQVNTQRTFDVMRSPPRTLTTPRLHLRPVEYADARRTAELVTPDVAANLSTWASPMSEEQAVERIRRSQDMLAKGEAVDFAITNGESSELLGWIGLATTAPGTARLGYWLGRSYRGRGVMTEAVMAFVPAAGIWLDASLIKAQTLSGNDASSALLLRAGFRREGEDAVLIERTGETVICSSFALHLS